MAIEIARKKRSATQRSMRVSAVTTIFILCSFFSLQAAVIYDVTFSEITDVLGQPASTGSPLRPSPTPSDRVFGTSRVLGSAGDLTDRPLQLIPRSTGTGFRYSQYKFGIPVEERTSTMQFDLDLLLEDFDDDPDDVFSSSADHDYLSLVFDTPTVVRLDLFDTGRILQNSTQIGTFTLGVAFHLSVFIDLPGNLWTISKDREQLFSGLFFRTFSTNPTPPTEIHALRINLSDGWSSSATPFAAIDNVRITSNPGAVPEPSTAFLVLVGSAFTAFYRPRRRR
jgi:hypothetical protein